MQNTLKMTEAWSMVTHVRVLSKSYPMNTNMTRYRLFTKMTLHPCSLSIGMVKQMNHIQNEGIILQHFIKEYLHLLYESS